MELRSRKRKRKNTAHATPCYCCAAALLLDDEDNKVVRPFKGNSLFGAKAARRLDSYLRISSKVAMLTSSREPRRKNNNKQQLLLLLLLFNFQSRIQLCWRHCDE